MDWHIVKSTVAVRPGQKKGWLEVIVTHPETKEVQRYVMRKVKNFYSEMPKQEVPE